MDTSLPGNDLNSAIENLVVQSVPTKGILTSEFGVRKHPISRRRQFHEGVDIANRYGVSIDSTGGGRVLRVERRRGYGLLIEIDHGDGWSSCYAHLSHANVLGGEVVKAGTLIGEMGRSGSATGVHLHYELRYHGSAVNPMPYLRTFAQWVASLQ